MLTCVPANAAVTDRIAILRRSELSILRPHNDLRATYHFVCDIALAVVVVPSGIDCAALSKRAEQWFVLR
jgi:hypothetical protein